MNKNIEISGIGIDYPSYGKVDYDSLRKYYQDKKIRIKSLMKILGKNGRFTGNNSDEYYKLMENASKESIKAAGININDLDMIVVATDTPEYLSPTNALRITNILQAKNVKVAFDMNANCAAGIISLDQVSSYMKENTTINNALVICAFMGSYVFTSENPISYCTFSDGVSAIVLKKTESSYGIIDTNYVTDSSYMEMDVIPASGFSEILRNEKRHDEDLKLGMDQGLDISFIPEIWSKQLENLFAKNKLTPEEISQYIFSQFSLYHIKSTIQKLHLSSEHYTYVGDKYGYTGECSPIFALYDAKKSRKIKTGDYIVLCGIGAGYTSAAMLYRVGKDDLNIL